MSLLLRRYRLMLKKMFAFVWASLLIKYCKMDFSGLFNMFIFATTMIFLALSDTSGQTLCYLFWAPPPGISKRRAQAGGRRVLHFYSSDMRNARVKRTRRSLLTWTAAQCLISDTPAAAIVNKMTMR